MAKLTDGKFEVEITQKGQEVLVTLESSQYQIKEPEQLLPFLKKSGLLLAGEVEEAKEEYIKLKYLLPEYARMLKEVAASATEIERLTIARELSVLEGWQNRLTCLFLHPENLFMVGGQLMVAHRGLQHLLTPSEKDGALFFKQYQALVISTIQPKYPYEMLVTGTLKVRDALSQEILAATTIEEVEQIVDRQYETLIRMQKATKKMVKKSYYTVFKWATIVLLAVSIGLGGWSIYSLNYSLPKQERIIEAQTAYMVNNFNEAVNVLARDNPATLPRSVQYLLASSYIRLENLSSEQRQEILNNISPNSTENELLYWIYSGRGLFERSLDIALNIGNNHLIIHAYGRRYDQVNADMTMEGLEKQRLLDHYMERIEHFLELLEGGAELEEAWGNEDEL